MLLLKEKWPAALAPAFKPTEVAVMLDALNTVAALAAVVLLMLMVALAAPVLVIAPVRVSFCVSAMVRVVAKVVAAKSKEAPTAAVLTVSVAAAEGFRVMAVVLIGTPEGVHVAAVFQLAAVPPVHEV